MIEKDSSITLERQKNENLEDKNAELKVELNRMKDSIVMIEQKYE